MKTMEKQLTKKVAVNDMIKVINCYYLKFFSLVTNLNYMAFLVVLQKKCVRWKDTHEDLKPHIAASNMPFIIMGKKLFPCHQGKDTDRAAKKKRRLLKESEQKVFNYIWQSAVISK